MTTVGEGFWFVEIEAPTIPRSVPPAVSPAPVDNFTWFVGFSKGGRSARFGSFPVPAIVITIYVVTRKLYGISVNCGVKTGDSRRWRGRLQFPFMG